MPRGTQGHRQESAHFRLRDFHLLRLPFPGHSASEQIGNSFGSLQRPCRALLPPPRNDCSLDTRQVWAVPLSLATTQGMISLPGGTKMFQFPPFPPPAYGFSRRYPGIPPGGFPHSEISGSKPADGSPKLIAVNHVLRRLLAPRHPPYALSSLTCVMTQRNELEHPHSVQFLRCYRLWRQCREIAMLVDCRRTVAGVKPILGRMGSQVGF